MTIEHHPPDSMLAAYAGGSLDPGQHVAIATHLAACASCRRFARSMEQVGGAVLTAIEPSAMASDALSRIQGRLDEMTAGPASDLLVAAPAVPEGEIPGLPGFVRRFRFGPWQWVAPSVHVRRIVLPHESPTRVFLLRSGPGTEMLPHAHTGFELTCVLAGAFRQGDNRYAPGDFDLGDEHVDHRPIVDVERDCICLVAMQGELRLKGILGRIVQPFVHL